MASTKKCINIVVASCSNRGIGKDDKLPWRIRGDMAFFKKLTYTAVEGKQNAVIMGRKTWLSIPSKFRPLANRINIVLSTADHLDVPSGVYHARSFESSLSLINSDLHDQVDQVYVIGGSSVYEMALKSPHLHRIYHTEIYKEFECDTFLPAFDSTKLRVVTNCAGVPDGAQEENDIPYEFKVYQTISSST